MARVVYLGGLGRSGTTLLERILGELPGVCPVGEVVHLWERGLRQNERCGCGQAFHDCAFWREVGAVAFGGWSAVDVERVLALKASVDRSRFIPRLAAARLEPALRRRVEEYDAYYAALYAAIAQVSGAHVVIDSSKHASLAFCLRLRRDLDLRVVHVVRDARGVAYSWTKTVRRPDAVGAESFMTTYSPLSAALLWDAHNVSFHLLRRLGTPTRLVRYEQLMSRPVALVRELATFAGLPYDTDLSFVGDDHVLLSTAHTVAGNPMRFTTGAVALRPDDAWRAQLPPAARRTVLALTLPLLARYGYLTRSAAGRRVSA